MELQLDVAEKPLLSVGLLEPVLSQRELATMKADAETLLQYQLGKGETPKRNQAFVNEMAKMEQTQAKEGSAERTLRGFSPRWTAPEVARRIRYLSSPNMRLSSFIETNGSK